MACSACGMPHSPETLCPRLQQVAISLDLFSVPAFLTDPLNRFLCVNQAFARMIGDPVREGVPSDFRFIDAAIIGPYRERFPRGKQEVAQCASGLLREVEAGCLSPGALRLLEHTLDLDEDLRRMAQRIEVPWDGTLVIKDHGSKMSLVREQVVVVADSQGGDSGFHVSWWLPAEREPPEILRKLPSSSIGAVATLLTSRQLEVARWYAAGLNSRAVSEKAGITPKTARDHLEEIYSRLDVHSRAELAGLLVRQG